MAVSSGSAPRMPASDVPKRRSRGRVSIAAAMNAVGACRASSSRYSGAHLKGLVAALLCSRHSTGGFGGVSAGTAGGVASWDSPIARGTVVVFFFFPPPGSRMGERGASRLTRTCASSSQVPSVAAPEAVQRRLTGSWRGRVRPCSSLSRPYMGYGPLKAIALHCRFFFF